MHLDVKMFLGAGKYGSVISCDAFLNGQRPCGAMVIKQAHSGCEDTVKSEYTSFQALFALYGIFIPRCYGHFVSTGEDSEYSMLLLADGGTSLQSFQGLSYRQRLEILAILWMVHRRGVYHGDVHPGNVLSSSRGLHLIDFSLASTSHICPGLTSCSELVAVAEELNLRGTATYFIPVWSIVLFVFRYVSIWCSRYRFMIMMVSVPVSLLIVFLCPLPPLPVYCCSR